MAFPVDRQFIERAEHQLGCPLPEALVRRLCSENGGEVEAAGDTWQLHPVFDDTDRKRIARTANHLLRETEVARRWSGFPAQALAIASNGSGDHLVLVRDGNRFDDTVYWWDHETGELNVAAKTFADLSAGLE
jgi:hypothetical protein